MCTPTAKTAGTASTSSGAQLTDTDILANNLSNSTALQQGWVQHLVARSARRPMAAYRFISLITSPAAGANTHRDIEPTARPTPPSFRSDEQYAAVDETSGSDGHGAWALRFHARRLDRKPERAEQSRTRASITCSRWLPITRQRVSAFSTTLMSTTIRNSNRCDLAACLDAHVMGPDL